MKTSKLSTLSVGSTLLLACALSTGCGDDSSKGTSDGTTEADSGSDDSTKDESDDSDDADDNSEDDSSDDGDESSEDDPTITADDSNDDNQSDDGEADSGANTTSESDAGNVVSEDGGLTSEGDAGTDASDAGDETTSSDSGTSEEAGSDAPDDDALFALVTRVYGEESDQSYVLLTDDPSSGSLDLADAVIEVPGLALGTGIDDSGALFVASDSASTVTRYDLSDEGELVEGDTVDFSVQGIAYVGEYGGQFQYVSPDKAYWFSGEAARIVVWNPEEMTISDSIELDSLVHEGEALTFSAAPIRRGNRIYTFAAWHTPPPALTIVSRTAVIVLDTETDEVEVVQDSRSGYVRDGVFGDDGQLYVVTEGLGAAVNFLNADNAPAPTVLRFDPEALEFDSDYEVDLNGLFDADPAGMLVLSGSGQAFVRFLDPSLVAGAESPMAVAGAAAWGWATFTAGDEPSVEILQDAPKSAGRLTPIKAGGKVYVPEFVDGESTRFTVLTAEGPAADALEVPGLVFSAVKLR